ncbi:MAG: NADH pyrophosphatase, decaps 5'-NAD modified RNA [Pseudolabrys sp.]|jgi:NAD+ diphosphatase|nr:NADH pyrophosphatase, decaps 5'-NAD modified RNA [Pseudolabrys sp.]
MPARYALGPKPHLGYTDSPLQRAAELRLRGDEVKALATSPDAGAYVIGGEMIVTKTPNLAGAAINDPLFALDEAAALADPAETIFLGTLDGAARFGIGIAPQAAEALKSRGDLLVTDLRSIAVRGLVAQDHLPPIAEAKAMLHWHARHRFCANCGTPTNVTQCGWRRDCPQCQAQHFPRTDPVVIMLAVRGERCLLGRSPRFAATMWSCLAGFVEPGETIADAARRETLEEAGIRCGRVTFFRSQPWPFPMSLMIGCHAEALNNDIVVDRSELEDARWFHKDEIAAMLMRAHPQGLTTPPPVAIAHHIIRAWVEDEIRFD